MAVTLIPEPKECHESPGNFSLPRSGSIAVSDWTLFPFAEDIRDLLGKRTEIALATPGIEDILAIGVTEDLRPDEYRLDITASGMRIEGQNPRAVFYALQTLKQIIAQSPKRKLPLVSITDWPDFAYRGVYYDVCRGRVPKLSRLEQMAEVLAHYKINQLQLYIEHTFRFRRHPDIGKDADPLSAEDIMSLDSVCRRNHIELVPSLASFGHMATVLKHKQYHHLAEDWGNGKYLDPEAENHRILKAWSLAPANPEVYDFLDELFAEYLPCFSSPRFNVCCDETWDLGLGQSYELAQKIGKGQLYLNHILKLNELAKKYGKRIQMWGDIVRNYPELIEDIPKDITVLDWGYEADMTFDRVKDFVDTGLDTYVCPSVSGYRALFPRLPESCANIAGWAAAGRKHGATGLLNTDWGDGGHFNFTECAWFGYLFGAEQAWNADSNRASFPSRFCNRFLQVDSSELEKAVLELGDIAQLACESYYQSIWMHIFFACPGDAVFDLQDVNASISVDGDIQQKRLSMTADLATQTIERLLQVRDVLEREQKGRTVDPLGVMPYWVFAVDTLLHAARKLTILGPGGEDTTEGRKDLKKELKRLRKRFEKLWMARNRRSEINLTLDAYNRVLKAL
ncbi:MAG: family 20 glycosylhydrolase [Candidatus Pacebacteria bacterium]|nr:family 20 glycosylhydrolase [Candidatus Paceibacterota bacterium]